MILIVSSRKPSRRTRSFCKDLRASIPRAIYITRGKRSLDEFFKEMDEKDRLIHVSEIKGNPSRLVIYDREKNPLLAVFIKGVRLIRETKRYGYAVEEEKEGSFKILKMLSESLLTRLKAREVNNSIIFDTGLVIRIRGYKTREELEPLRDLYLGIKKG